MQVLFEILKCCSPILYTWNKKTLSIRFGIGLEFAAGIFKLSSQKAHTINLYYTPALPAFRLDIQYVFTKHFGINEVKGYDVFFGHHT